MAKVMISMPDDMLARVDARAKAHGSTRSATIREFVEDGLDEPRQRLRDAMADLGDYARPRPMSAVEALRLGRAERTEKLGGAIGRQGL